MPCPITAVSLLDKRPEFGRVGWPHHSEHLRTFRRVRCAASRAHQPALSAPTHHRHGARSAAIADAGCVLGGTIIVVEPRSLTERERAVLDALLGVDFPGAEKLRREATEVVVVGMRGCGCPSVDFSHAHGMTIRINAAVSDSNDGLFLYTVEDPQQGEVLGGIEWVGIEETNPDEFPTPGLLDIQPV